MSTLNDGNAAPDPVIPLDQCTMTPAGVRSMIHHLQQNPLFANQPMARLGAAAIAFIAFGATNDNRHAIRAGGFHPDHYPANTAALPNWRSGLRDAYRSVIDDLVSHFAFGLV